MTLPKHLADKRDEGAKEHKELMYAKACTRSLSYKAGFDACYALTSEREKMLVEALEFYANEKNWTDSYGGSGLPLNLRELEIINKNDKESSKLLPGYTHNVGGKLARETLAKLKETE